jgi:hypothetical protein
MSDIAGPLFVQYGALGILTLAALVAVRVLFVRVESALRRETERADRLELELRQLNDTVRTEYVDTITRAAQAISDANRAVADALAAVRRG